MTFAYQLKLGQWNLQSLITFWRAKNSLGKRFSVTYTPTIPFETRCPLVTSPYLIHSKRPSNVINHYF